MIIKIPEGNELLRIYRISVNRNIVSLSRWRSVEFWKLYKINHSTFSIIFCFNFCCNIFYGIKKKKKKISSWKIICTTEYHSKLSNFPPLLLKYIIYELSPHSFLCVLIIKHLVRKEKLNNEFPFNVLNFKLSRMRNCLIDQLSDEYFFSFSTIR